MESLNSSPLHVLLVAPPLVCWGLHRLVRTAGPQFGEVLCAADLAEAQPLLAPLPPDVLVLDLDDGYAVEEITQLHERLRVKVLAVTSRTEPVYLDRVLAGGARGVLSKREGPPALLQGIEAVGHGREFALHGTPRPAAEAQPAGALRPAPPPAPPAITLGHDQPQAVAPAFRSETPQPAASSRAPDRAKLDAIGSLTQRERQTLAAVTADASAPAKVVAGRLCISEHTLRNHLTSIYSKLGVSSRLALHAFASEHREHLRLATFRP